MQNHLGRLPRPARLLALLAALFMVITVVPATVAGADGHIRVTYSWSELTEGITVDKTGNVFVSHGPAGELWKITPGAAGPEVFGTIDGINAAEGDLGLVGLAVDAPGNVYATVVSFTNPDANGVWKFNRKTGEATKAPGTEGIVLGNAIAFDKRGNMYITDSAIGGVWRIPAKGGPAEPWIVDEVLEGTGAFGVGVPIGANGIVYRKGSLYVANSEKGLMVKIPIKRNGSAGTPSIELNDPASIFGIDGIAMDVTRQHLRRRHRSVGGPQDRDGTEPDGGEPRRSRPGLAGTRCIERCLRHRQGQTVDAVRRELRRIQPGSVRQRATPRDLRIEGRGGRDAAAVASSAGRAKEMALPGRGSTLRCVLSPALVTPSVATETSPR